VSIDTVVNGIASTPVPSGPVWQPSVRPPRFRKRSARANGDPAITCGGLWLQHPLISLGNRVFGRRFPALVASQQRVQDGTEAGIANVISTCIGGYLRQSDRGPSGERSQIPMVIIASMALPPGLMSPWCMCWALCCARRSACSAVVARSIHWPVPSRIRAKTPRWVAFRAPRLIERSHGPCRVTASHAPGSTDCHPAGCSCRDS